MYLVLVSMYSVTMYFFLLAFEFADKIQLECWVKREGNERPRVNVIWTNNGSNPGLASFDMACFSLCLSEPVFCPRASNAQSSLRLKCMLQHQPWAVEYNLDPDE